MQLANSKHCSESILPLISPSATGLTPRSQPQGMPTPAGRGGRARPEPLRLQFRRDKDKAAPPSVSDSSEDDRGSEKAHLKFDPVVSNPAFDDYYKMQGIVSHEEWETFVGVLRTPLPAAFRVSPSQFCAEIISQLENDFRKSIRTEDTADDSEAITPLPWYPKNLAWRFNYSRRQLRKDNTLERFHKFLKLENEIGNITRQEAVSMVPPLLLDVLPEHFVLDMCAAPGSKTYQLLEIINQSNRQGYLPDGLIVANDLVVQRCDHLIHKMKRMNTANLVVTNHEAQCFPGFLLVETNASQAAAQLAIRPHQLLFDRVLCDVPCSGDGTLRKAPNIWRRWNSGMGNGLHSLQLQIAMRGIALLKIGGRMVYSTCSMNPVENEAVVAEVLRRCEGSVELVDISSELPQLIRRPGLTRWKIRDKDCWFSHIKDVPNSRRGGIVCSMFPPDRRKCNINDPMDPQAAVHGSRLTVNDGDSVSRVHGFPLERCMRILPHDQNGGAFFIAVFNKLAPLPALRKRTMSEQEPLPISPEQLSDLVEDAETLEVSPSKRKEKAGGKRDLGKWKGVDPIVFLKDESIIDNIKSFYGIGDSFPLRGHLVIRNSDANCGKRVYYVSKSVKDLLEMNFKTGQQLKIPFVGLKMFERKRSKQGPLACPFRISSEALPLILPYITKQLLSASELDFKLLLQYQSIKFADFADRGFGEQARKLIPGGCVIVLSKDSEALKYQRAGDSTIAIGCWKGKTSLNVMVSPPECQELFQRLFLGEIGQNKSLSHGNEPSFSSDGILDSNFIGIRVGSAAASGP